jgi:hypothetical protein
VKLRIAKKILKAVGTPDEARYSDYQIGRANRRMARTRSAKEADRFWFALMDHLGVDGRAKLLARCGAPGMAFDLLMREGDSNARR